MALGNALFVWTCATNTFAIPVVKHQADREHKVISTGPYAYVRHPMYSCLFVVFIGTSLMLGSLWGLPLTCLIESILAVRVIGEERVLHKNLPGYGGYCKRVRSRLVPFVW
jgi:protein-S-isoprenylcysteine O-methyltransferase Ste14